MASRTIAVPSFDLVIVGATGDLARRKLLPALFQRDRAGQIPPGARIIGAARRAMDEAGFRAEAAAAIAAASPTPEEAARFLARLGYVHLDATGQEGWSELAGMLDASTAVRVFYLATAPELFAPLCARIAAHGLAGDARVVVEKPIGHDLASAAAVNTAIGAVFPERSIYRIDHYLGKETVQNLMALRFANALFEPIWNSAHIDHVQITVAETLGVEGRADYYDRAGALRDMVQNHMLQLLCLTAMEPPTSLDADAVRDEKLKVLHALVPLDAATESVRGQYRAGAADGGPVAGYREEVGHPSNTETFVALRAGIANWRWAGVPFFLRTGKRLPQRLSEIVVAFRAVPHNAFGAAAGPVRPNRLAIRLQPDESIDLWLMIKDPGPGGMRLRQVALNMSFDRAFGVRNPDAYERLLMDVVRGNQTLFMRRDEVEAAWRWVDPILAAWETAREPPRPYTAGTWGPAASVALIERSGRTWYDDGGFEDGTDAADGIHG
ncbi:MAG: glucose-6-phosphate dehydrogenase [Rhodospirillales bacterium]|nr:glucose-6-phosphate dehydrogenase [Rhodospirillales bacterium]